MEDSDIEIRPYLEPEDFGEAFTHELQEQEAAIRARELGLSAPSFQLRPELVLVGINQTYTMESRIGIPQQWEQFVRQADSIPDTKGTTFYGVCWNTKPDCSFDYLTGVEVATAIHMPNEFTSLKVDARRYAVFAQTSHVSVLPKAIEKIWSKWVPDCGLKIANAPCVECYTSEFNPGTGMGGMKMWIPLEF